MDLAKVGKKLNHHKPQLNRLKSIHTEFCRNLTESIWRLALSRVTQVQRKMNSGDESKASNVSAALSNDELWKPAPFSPPCPSAGIIFRNICPTAPSKKWPCPGPGTRAGGHKLCTAQLQPEWTEHWCLLGQFKKTVDLWALFNPPRIKSQL